MFQIVYVSAAVEPMSEGDLKTLLRQSRENNKEFGLTGMLLYKNERFMQALEGEREAVEEIYYERICKDKRHEGVVQLMGSPIEERDFPDWTMGFRSEGGLDPVDERSFTPFADENFTPTHFTDNLGTAHRMLLDFRDVPAGEEASQKDLDKHQRSIDRVREQVAEAQRDLDERQEALDGRNEREEGEK